MRTTRFGNGAEKVRKITVTKPDAMAARKKDKEENETLDDLQQNEDERGSYQPLFKANSKAAERTPSRSANVLRRLDERRAVGVENRSCEPIHPRPRRPPFIFKPCGFFLGAERGVPAMRIWPMVHMRRLVARPHWSFHITGGSLPWSRFEAPV